MLHLPAFRTEIKAMDIRSILMAQRPLYIRAIGQYWLRIGQAEILIPENGKACCLSWSRRKFEADTAFHSWVWWKGQRLGTTQYFGEVSSKKTISRKRLTIVFHA